MSKQDVNHATTRDDGTIVEPSNSTVDDWIGQRVERDTARADEALRDAGGDQREAERRFEQGTERRRDEPVTDGDPGGEPQIAADDGDGHHGFGPSDIPDPMPDSLRDVPDQTESVDEMGGEAPTG
jgi:hypothetical protein